MDVRQQSKAAKQQKNAVKIHLLFRVTPPPEIFHIQNSSLLSFFSLTNMGEEKQWII